MHRSLPRADLLGRTVPLLHLYLQPSLMSYSPFNDFPALYNASSTLFRLVFKDLMILGRIESTGDVLPVMAKLFASVEGNLLEYLPVIGRLVNEFGNVGPREEFINQMGGVYREEFINQISLITGESLRSITTYANNQSHKGIKWSAVLLPCLTIVLQIVEF